MSESSGPPITESEANAIYDVLVKYAGEHEGEHDRSDFVSSLGKGCVEYRFMGSLGFGGKFWNNNGWYVSCYGEDLTPERDAAIKRTNAALARLASPLSASSAQEGER